jgi:transcriptional regulator with XRE-family HTH domain
MTETITPVWTLGDRLRKARSQAGITSEQMAATIGTSRGTISNYENDHTDIPVKAIMKWSALTGVSLEWLISGDEPNVKKYTILGSSPPDPMQQTLFALAA